MISNRKKTKQPNTVDIIAFQLKIILQTLKGKLTAISLLYLTLIPFIQCLCKERRAQSAHFGSLFQTYLIAMV